MVGWEHACLQSTSVDASDCGDVVCLILSVCLERMLGREGLCLPVSLLLRGSASASECVCMYGYLCVCQLCMSGNV